MVKRYSTRLWRGIGIGILLLAIPLATVFAADYLDHSFGAPEGFIWLSGSYSSTSIKSDGKILVMVSDQNHLVQLSTDGWIDNSFGTNGLVTLPSNLTVDAALTPDGKIIVAGVCDLNGDGASTDVNLQRLLSNGHPDPSFNGGNPACRSVSAPLPLLFLNKVLILPDGKILVLATNMFAGDIIGGGSLLARFDANGNLDPTFGSGGIFMTEVPYPPGGSSLGISKMIIQSGGTILLIGTVSNWRNPLEMPVYTVVIRLTSSGQYDSTFNGNGVFAYYDPTSYIHGYNIAVQQSGRIIFEVTEETSGASTDFLLGLTSSGAIDITFGDAGKKVVPEKISDLLILPNDDIVTAGYADPNLVIRMFDSNGAVNTSFANGGPVSYNFLGSPSNLKLQPNGKIILTSSSSSSNTTYVARIVPIFQDLSFYYWATRWIERLYAAGITGGCETTPLQYCPENSVTRAQMAVFLERGIHGSSYTPPAVGVNTGFNDVPTNYWAAAWIKQLAAEGITSGCGAGNYCPDNAVTRAQMAVFLLKSKYGPSYTPPSVGTSTGFNDVPTNYWSAAWIKQLAAEGITGGCGTNLYCPESAVTRAQMAVFLVRTFNLP